MSPSKSLGPTFRRARWYFFFATYMMMTAMMSSTSTPTIIMLTGHSPAVCTMEGGRGVVVVTRGEGSSNSVSTSSSVGLYVVDVVSWGSQIVTHFHM